MYESHGEKLTRSVLFDTSRGEPDAVLAALPDGLALLGESGRSLARVLRDEHRSGDLALLLPHLLGAPLGRLDRDPLRRGERERRVPGDRLGQLERRLDRDARLGEAVDEAELVAPLGGNRVPGQCHLHGDVERDATRQAQQCAAGGDETALDLRDAQLGLARGDDQVTRQCDLEPAGDGEALDRGDQRLVGRALRDAGEAPPLDVWALAAHERLEVHAGAEALARAGDHADLELPVAIELLERRRDALRKRGVYRVARVGSVEGDQQHAPAALGEYGLLAHARNLPPSGRQPPRNVDYGRIPAVFRLSLAPAYRVTVTRIAMPSWKVQIIR